MLQRSTIEGLGLAPHWSTGYRFNSRSEQITWRSREPEPQLLEHQREDEEIVITNENRLTRNAVSVTEKKKRLNTKRRHDAISALHCLCALFPVRLTSPHSPTCQLICFGQAAISQGWTADGRSRVLQAVSSSLIPPEPTQVTSLVCSPEPQVTEHCRRNSTEFITQFTPLLDC